MATADERGAILTPPAISTLPAGLLRYLGIQSGGAMPRTIDPVIGTEFPIFDLMLGQTDVTLGFTTLLNAVGVAPVVGAVVTDNKCMCVSELGLRIVTVAAEAIKAGLVITTPSGVNVSLGSALVLAASTGDQQNYTFAKKIWLRPGDQLSINVYSITTAGTITSNVQLRKSDFFF